MPERSHLTMRTHDLKKVNSKNGGGGGGGGGGGMGGAGPSYGEIGGGEGGAVPINFVHGSLLL